MPLSATFAELFDEDLQRGRAGLINAVGYDPALSPHFWEAWVATVTTGRVTPHKHDHDVTLDAERELRLEVKFSRSFSVAFSNGARRCFKWLMTRPQMARTHKADAVLLIGVDVECGWMWCAPSAAVGRTMTVTVPSDRRGGAKGSPFDAYMIPPLDMLPAILRVCRTTLPSGA